MKVRSDVIRIYKTLHTWTGLIAGMALFIGFYAGSLTMFQTALDRWSAPPVAASSWPSPDRFDQLIDATLQTHPETANGFELHLSPTEGVPAPVKWQSNGDGARNRASLPGEAQYAWASLNDNGELIRYDYQPSPLGTLVDMLHQTAGIPGGGHHLFGVYVLGAVCVLYFLALVSGVIILLPTLVKDFFALRPGKNLKRFWLDAHNVIGIVSLPFHIVIAFTVVVFAFHDEMYEGLQKAVYGDIPLFQRAEAKAEFTYTRDTLQAPEILLDKVKQVAPDFQPRKLAYSNVFTPRASVRVEGTQDGYILRGVEYGFAILNPHTAELIDTDYLPGHQGTWIGIVTAFFSLHFGNFGGTLVRWGYFMLGLAGAFLFYSGNLLWIESRRRKQKRDSTTVKQKRTTELMAAATVGVCWGSIAGVCAAMAAGRWLAILIENPTAGYMSVYYGVFLGCVTWAFLSGAARAAVHLLTACGIGALLIPVTSLAALVLPGNTPAAPVSLAAVSVDLTAALAGILFFMAARRTAKRVYNGATDSVWSASTDSGETRPLNRAEA